jgi:hypothetical protein
LGPDRDAERRGAAEIGLEARNPDAVARRAAAVRRLLPDAFLAVHPGRAGGSAMAGPDGMAAAGRSAVDRLPGEVEQFLDAVARPLGVVRAGPAGQLFQAQLLPDAVELGPSGVSAHQPGADQPV